MFERSQRATALLLTGCIGLLGVLAFLQYRWIGEVSRSDEQRLELALHSGADRIAGEFDREIARVVETFRLPPREPLLSALTERSARWQAEALTPEIISGIYLFDPAAPSALQQFRDGRLTSADWPPALQPLRQRFSLREPIAAVSADAIVIPSTVPAEGDAQHAAFLIFALDQAALRERLLPAITARWLPSREFNAVIRDPRTEASSTTIKASRPPDISIPLFALRSPFPGLRQRPPQPERVAPPPQIERSPAEEPAPPLELPPPDDAADRPLLNHQPPPEQPDGAPRFNRAPPPERRDGAPSFNRPFPPEQRDGAHRFERGPSPRPPRGDRPPFNDPRGRRPRERFDLSPPQAPHMQGELSTRSPDPAQPAAQQRSLRPIELVFPPALWLLEVRHIDAPAHEVVERIRRRNLLLSGAVLLLLALSAALLVAGAHRAQALAGQQLAFITGVTHELYTPLAAIRSAGENLSDGVVRDDAQIRRYGSMIVGEGKRLTALIADALALAGVSNRKRDSLRLDLNAVVEEAIADTTAFAEANGATLQFAARAHSLAVTGDAVALRRAVNNLLSNAVKHGGKMVKVSTLSERHSALIEVRDDGPGIDPRDLPHLFKPFYRGRKSSEAQTSGSGLGLALVRQTMLEHGGTIRVRTPRSGTAIVLTLPLAEERA